MPPTGFCSESKRATGVEGKQRTDSHHLGRSDFTHEQLWSFWIYNNCESQILVVWMFVVLVGVMGNGNLWGLLKSWESPKPEDWIMSMLSDL